MSSAGYDIQIGDKVLVCTPFSEFEGIVLEMAYGRCGYEFKVARKILGLTFVSWRNNFRVSKILD